MGRHDQMVLDIGEDVDGYRVESFIARGGMAVVYKARDRRLGRPVALKLIAPELAADTTFRARFTRESELAASLDHPNVLPIYQAGELDGMLWTAMRFVDGEDLDTVLSRRGRLTPDETITIFTAVGAALDAAHARQLVHRDVKPGNILLTGQDSDDGDMNLVARHIYLTDFGLTKRSADVTGLTTAGQFLGTIAYVAPEQIASQAVDHRADVYSLGCVLYHVLTGAAPFARDDYVAMLWAHISSPPPVLSEVLADVPPAVDAVIQSAMAKEPSARPDSCGALVGQLRDAFGLAAQIPFRLADRPGKVAGVRDRYVSEPADDTPTVVKGTPSGPPAGAVPPVAAEPPGAAATRPASLPPRPSGPPEASGEATPPAAGPVPPSGESLEEALALRPVSSEPGPSPRRAEPTVVEPTVVEPALVEPTVVESPSGARAEAIAQRDSPPTLVSHRRDPEPPAAPDRPRRIALVAGLVALVVLAGGAGFWILRPDGPDRAVTAAPSRTPSASAAPGPSIPASVAKPTVLAQVKVGNGPQGIAFSRDGRRVYIANSNERSVSVVDNEDHRATRVIRTPNQPQYVAASPTLDRLYVSTHNDNGGGNAIVVIDTVKSTVVTSIAVEQATDSHPYALAVSPDGSLLYVPDHDREVVLVIDTATNKLASRLAVAPRPHSVAFAGSTAYVANHESNQVSVVDTKKTSVAATIPVGAAPHSVAASPDRSRVYTANYDDGTTSVIDTKTRKRIGPDAKVGTNPRCVAVSADGKHAYFAVTGDDTLTVLDTTTMKQTASIKLGVDPYVVAVSPDGRTGYVTNRESDTVTVLSLTA
ncbi:protein kinase domain-containing protein [Cryptosporangium arvum]|uniref:protein kinase domain-containing protein n=1 Tax=Cryptosporangium arvum TaxID=80871 RepID=UPI0004B2370A|nr:protein kinase [Cryptosporangium arvum]